MDCYLTIPLSHFVLVLMKSNPPIGHELLITPACFYLQFWQLSVCFSEINTPAVIGDNMVLQQNHKNPIWGWDNPGNQLL